MAGQWLRFFAGATLTLSVAGHALAEEGKVRFCRGIVNQRDAGYCESV
jgi:hypothetical protein